MQYNGLDAWLAQYELYDVVHTKAQRMRSLQHTHVTSVLPDLRSNSSKSRRSSPFSAKGDLYKESHRHVGADMLYLAGQLCIGAES